MTIPIEVLLALIGLLGSGWAYVTWQNKMIVDAYFRSIPEQTRILQTLAATIDKLDRRIDRHETDEMNHWEKACEILSGQQEILVSTMNRLDILQEQIAAAKAKANGS